MKSHITYFFCGCFLIVSCGGTEKREDSTNTDPKPPLTNPDANDSCEYRQIEGVAEFIEIAEKSPKNADNVLISFNFRPTEASQIGYIEDLVVYPGTGFATLVGIEFKRLCLEPNDVQVGRKRTLTISRTKKGACNPSSLLKFTGFIDGCKEV